VQLVLQAATLGSDGDIYMLDLGDPVKIIDLARKLVELSGLRPEKDIEIRIVGARPGEKLHEEFWTAGARVRPTSFQRVLAVEAEPVSADFEPALRELEAAALARNEALVLGRLQAFPIGFRDTERSSLARS
jgi:FlaA1/EpsC-like NDP-sugar epimerase